MFEQEVEKALGTIKGNDTWKQVFDRINVNRGIDLKTVTDVLICILEDRDDRKSARRQKPPRLPKKVETVSEGTGNAKEEVPSGDAAND